MRNVVAPLIAAFIAIRPVSPATYRCTVTKKVDPSGAWSDQRVRDGQWSVVIRDEDGASTVSRCSFSPSQKALTCDPYVVDRVEADPFVGHRKYYVFESQYDVQIFSDLTFVENNGRGSVSYGQCKMTPD